MTVYESGKRQNPWGVTRVEAISLDAVIEHGCSKKAAAVLRVTHDTIRRRCNAGGKKIDKGNRHMRYIKWHMWRKGVL